MPAKSAGLLMYRIIHGEIEVLLVHPGGPFWAKKDAGAWSIPKGEINPGEDALAAAKREFGEETGFEAEGPFVELGSVRQKSGKIVTAWAFQGDCDPSGLQSNTFEMEWPPRSGQRKTFPEVDRAGFFPVKEASGKINATESEFLTRLENLLRERATSRGVAGTIPE